MYKTKYCALHSKLFLKYNSSSFKTGKLFFTHQQQQGDHYVDCNCAHVIIHYAYDLVG
jgi:hypothetical protein